MPKLSLEECDSLGCVWMNNFEILVAFGMKGFENYWLNFPSLQILLFAFTKCKAS